MPFRPIETADTFENNNADFYALFAEADNASGYLLGAYNSSSGSIFYVDPGANVYGTSFTSTGSASRISHRTLSGRHVMAFAAESSRATLEDFGSARLVNGTAVVAMDNTFRETIDARAGYSVFVTPNGDNRGLYVVKSPGSFVIHEAQGGRSTLPVDYRIVAHPAGEDSARLPEAAPPHASFAQLGRAH